MNWDSVKDEALWKILSGAAKKQIDCKKSHHPLLFIQANLNQGTKCRCRSYITKCRQYLLRCSADRFEVPVDFLLQQVAWLTERHASQVRAQVRKATAAVRGSGPSPVPGGDSAGPGHQRTHSALSFRRDSPMLRNELGSGVGTPLNASMRPLVTRNTTTNTTVLRDMTGGPASPRPGVGLPSRTGERRRLSSLPITSVPAKSPEQLAQPEPSPDEPSPSSPGPAEDSSPTSSDDESAPAQSRIIRRPPRFQQPDGGQYENDDDDESEPAFQPYTSPSSKTSAQDLGSTLRGDGRGSGKRHHRHHGKPIHQSNTSDSSASSAAMIQKPDSTDKATEQRTPGPLSPRRTAELAGRSPGSKNKGYSHEGSDGTPSMGSSYSDLDGKSLFNLSRIAELVDNTALDASVTQSALEEALASHMNRGAGSRFSISQAFRSRYNPSSNQ